MLALIEPLPNIALSKNSIFFKLRSTDTFGIPYQAQPMVLGFVIQQATMDITTPLTVGYTEPNGTLSNLVFTFRSLLTDETHLPTLQSGDNFADWVATVVFRLGKHSRIAPYFSVSSEAMGGGQYRLIFRPKTLDDSWILALTTPGSLIVSTDAPVDPIADNTPPQYRIRYEVFFENTYQAGDYKKVYSGIADSDTSGYSTIDLSDTLHTYARQYCNATTPPAYYPTAAPLVVDNIRQYYVRFGEEYGTPIVPHAWSYSGVKRVMHGGIADNLFNFDSPLNRMGGLNAFLSFQQGRKAVIPTVPEWLNWYNYTAETRMIRLSVACYNTDLSASQEILGATVTVLPFQTAALPMALKAYQDAAALVGFEEVHKVVVKVVDTTGYAWSEERTFYEDVNNYAIAPRIWCYFNSFGCPETFVFRGDSLRVKGVISKSVVTSEKTDRTFLQRVTEVDSEVTVAMVYRTGHMTKGEMETLLEALAINNAFEVLPRGFIPLSISSQKLPALVTEDALVQADIQAEPRIQPRLYASIGLDYTGGAYWNVEDVQRTDDAVWWQALSSL